MADENKMKEALRRIEALRQLSRSTGLVHWRRVLQPADNGRRLWIWRLKSIG